MGHEPIVILNSITIWAVWFATSPLGVKGFQAAAFATPLAKWRPSDLRPLDGKQRMVGCTLQNESGSSSGRTGSCGSLESAPFVKLSPHEARKLNKAGHINIHPSKRQRRRKRAPPSELQQWLTKLGTLPGGLKMLLDLDNNADAVDLLEEAEIESMLSVCSVRGFAGHDYCGPEPGWLPIHRCPVRTKNGADFVLAFWAGRLVESALAEWRAATTHRAQRPVTAAASPGLMVIVSADAGMEVVAGEVRGQGLEAHVIKNMGELGTLLKALAAIDHAGPGLHYVKPPLSELDLNNP